MIDTLQGFKDSKGRNKYLIALPVLAFFGFMLCWFVFDGDELAARMYARLTSTSAQPEIQAATPDHIPETCLRGSHSQPDASCNQTQIDASAAKSETGNTEIRQVAIPENRLLDTEEDKSTPATPSDALSDEDNGNQGEPMDGVIAAPDKCPQVAGTRKHAGCPEPTKQKDTDETATIRSIATGITFETASSRLTDQSKTLLDQVAQILSRYPSVRLTVEGYTDDLGDATINLQLSEQRARACVSYLSRKGIDASRMNAVGYGESRPLAANSSAEARRRNRRVEFKISNQ